MCKERCLIGNCGGNGWCICTESSAKPQDCLKLLGKHCFLLHAAACSHVLKPKALGCEGLWLMVRPTCLVTVDVSRVYQVEADNCKELTYLCVLGT